jgi:hypothetical protein
MAKQSPAKAADDLIADLSDTAVPELVAEREELERAAEVNEPQAEVPVEAPVARQGKPFVFDEQNWRLTVNDKHGVFECDLMGMNPHVQMRLAATGLASLLRGRANKQKLLEGIMGGKFGGKRRQNYPATVIAYATMMGITVEESYSQWQQLNNEEKMVIRQMPRIRIVLAEMAAAKEAHEGVDA